LCKDKSNTEINSVYYQWASVAYRSLLKELL